MICPGCQREVSAPHPVCLKRIANGSRASVAAPDRTAERGPAREGYDCGCRPGNYCIGHGIQAMPQGAIDTILRAMPKTPRRGQA